ncbi:MAG: hypothetical protein ISR90_04645 [Candidatus Marinimicrobia bacterium]|nr:hypothetical protein [Candidatus Neomarinimicrobiota bacterium]MBL7023327.1 hypothetical protein [Candidatus Neomarinimicrobiota bacterium]
MNAIITKQLFDQSESNILPDGFVVDPEDVHKVINILKTIRKQSKTITVYDITKSELLKNEEIITVSDHINKTGHNPIIGVQKELKVDFTDLSHLYKRSKKHVVATCFGNRQVPGSAEYPAGFLCNITILAKAIGFKNIKGKLINCL